MKLIGFIIVSIILHGCQAEEPDEHHISEIELPPSILESKRKLTSLEFEKQEIYFGEINDSTSVMGEFKFKNTGDFPVQFRQVRPSCNCTVPKYEREVASGKNSTIQVNFTPKSVKPGTKTYQSSTVEIVGNFEDTIYLKLSAIVKN